MQDLILRSHRYKNFRLAIGTPTNQMKGDGIITSYMNAEEADIDDIDDLFFDSEEVEVPQRIQNSDKLSEPVLDGMPALSIDSSAEDHITVNDLDQDFLTGDILIDTPKDEFNFEEGIVSAVHEKLELRHDSMQQIVTDTKSVLKLDSGSKENPCIIDMTDESSNLENEINQALLTFNNFDKQELTQYSSSSSSTDLSPFDLPGSNLSESSNDDSTHKAKEPAVNLSTIASIKQSMVHTSKLNSLFMTLKVTYLKLCKEFNYLLFKFNENERIKIELIHENNELKKLLTDTIRDREIDRRNFKKEINDMKEVNNRRYHGSKRVCTSRA